MLLFIYFKQGKLNMINNNIGNIEQNTFVNYLKHPYVCSQKHFKVSSNPEYPLWDRVKHFVIGLSLCIPIANYIFYWALQKFSSLNSEPDSTHIPGKIKFGQARARIFDKEAPPADLAFIQSQSLIFNDQPRNKAKEPKTPIERRVPPISIVDTAIYGFDKNGQIKSAKSIHGVAACFADEDILLIHKVIRKEQIPLNKNIFIEYSEHGKAIIQQQATRGCTAAVAAMLIADHGKTVDIHELKMRNLGGDTNILKDIRKAGLTPIETEISSLDELRKAIEKNGSGIVSITGDTIGNHVIVVDNVSADLKSVRLRDPYHGWEITVKAESFCKYHGFVNSKVIQVKI